MRLYMNIYISISFDTYSYIILLALMFQPVLIGVLLSQTDELSLDTDYEKNVCLTRDFVCDVETAISEAAI